jgi:hypothetical protein
MALFGPFLDALRLMEHNTVETACSRSSGEPLSPKSSPCLLCRYDHCTRREGLGLVLKGPRPIG